MPLYRRKYQKAGKVEHRWAFRKVVTLPDGTKKRISGVPARNTKLAAEQAEREAIDRVMAPPVVAPPSKETPLFRDFADEFVTKYAMANNKPAEVQSKQTILKHHLVPAFGDKRLDEIGLRDIEGYKAEKLKKGRVQATNGQGLGLSWKTINNHLAVLRRLLAVATEWEIIKVVPSVKWLKGLKPGFDFLDFDEAQRIIEAADGEWTALITVALKTGLRQGELLALRWDDVDLKAGRIVVRQNLVRGIIGTPKSGKDREVPLSDDALKAFKGQRHLRGEVVFCKQDGSYFAPNEWKHPLWRTCKRAGLRRIGWHVLRHTFASHLVMRGVPLKVVQELLGHSAMEMTMRYAHLSPGLSREAVKMLDGPAAPNWQLPKSSERNP